MRPISITLLALFITSRAAFAEPLRQVRIANPDARSLAATLEREGYDVLEGATTAKTIELVVSVDELRVLDERGFAPQILAVGRPLRAIQAERAESGVPPPGYPDLAEILAQLASVESAHPAIAELVDLTAAYGTPPTVEGRPLHALKISDNVHLEEDEPAFLLVSTHHAREIVTPVIALHDIDRLVTGYGTDPAITAIVDNNELWIAPVWNPDGYEYVFTTDNFWRKNRRVFANGVGVDINRNYPQGWSNPCSGSTQPSSETYKGPSPASESETQTMLAWSLDQRFAKVLDYHSSGREVIRGYACWNYPFDAYLVNEAIELSTTSGYGGSNREPSADGEHYQWQFAFGAHAFLIETHTEFQPPYASAVAEAQLLWPGGRWMLELPIPLWGYVTDAVSGTSLAANIGYVGVDFPNGEVNASDGPDGRFHGFVPPGTYSVRFDAPGYQPLTIAGVMVANGTSTRLDAALTPTAAAVLPASAPGGDLLGQVSARGTSLHYEVLRPAHVALRIYDVRGTRVATLVESHHLPGRYDVTWRGQNGQGHRAAAGSYAYRLQAETATRSGKMLLLR